MLKTKGTMFTAIVSVLVTICCSGLAPLHNACSYGHYEVTELLLKVYNNMIPQSIALYYSMELMSMLLTCGSLLHCMKQQPRENMRCVNYY